MQKLSIPEAQAAYKKLGSGWNLSSDPLERQFQFSDFVQAFAFLTAVALLAEKKNHHPDQQNVYNKVNIALSTHDAGGLTMKDFELAREIDEIAAGIE